MNLGGAMALSLVVGLVDKMTGPARKVIDSTKGVERAMARASQMRTMGAGLITGGGLAAGAGVAAIGQLRDLMGASYDVEEALASVATVAPGTLGSVQKDLAAVRGSALAWSKVHTDSAAQYVRSSYLMVSAGLDTTQALAGTETALRVAKATMGDATEAASLLATVYNTMGNKAAPVTQEMARLGDVVTRTQQYFKIANLGQLASGLAYAVPQAKALGVGLEETSAILGQLNTMGLEGSMAGTAFSAMMRQMLKASKELGFGLKRTATGGIDVIGTIEGMRNQFGSFAEMSDQAKMRLQQAFGDEGSAALKILLGETGALRKGVREVTNSIGAAARAQQTMEATGLAAWQRLGNQVDLLKIAIGDQLGPVLGRAVEGVRSVVDSFAGFAAAHPMVARVASWVAVLAAGLLAVGGIAAVVVGSLIWTFSLPVTGLAQLVQGILYLKMTAFPAFAVVWGGLVAVTKATLAWTVALLTNPITWVVVGIMALIAGIVLLIRNWDTVAAVARRVWAAVTGAFWSAVAGIGQALTVAWDWVTGLFARLWDWMTGFGARMWESGAGLFNAFIEGVKSVASRVWDTVRDVLKGVRELLPFSDAKAGPLSTLTLSGRRFTSTWAQGITREIPNLKRSLATVTAAAAIAVAPAQAPSLTDALRNQVVAPEVPAVRSVLQPAAAGARRDRGSRPITIQRLVLTVNAEDVASAESLTSVLKGLAEQHA